MTFRHYFPPHILESTKIKIKLSYCIFIYVVSIIYILDISLRYFDNVLEVFVGFVVDVPRAPAPERGDRPGPLPSWSVCFNRVRLVCALVSIFRALPCAAISLRFCPVPSRPLPSLTVPSCVAPVSFLRAFSALYLVFPSRPVPCHTVPYAVVPCHTVPCLVAPPRGMPLSCHPVPCCVIPIHVFPCRFPAPVP